MVQSEDRQSILSDRFVFLAGADFLKQAMEALNVNQSSDNSFQIFESEVHESYESFHAMDEGSGEDNGTDNL